MHNHVPEIYKPLSLKVYGFLSVSLIALVVQEYPYGFPASSNLIGLVYLLGAMITPPMHGCFVNRLKRHSFTALGVWTDVVAVLAFFA